MKNQLFSRMAKKESLCQHLLRQSEGREQKDALRLLDEIVGDGNVGLRTSCLWRQRLGEQTQIVSVNAIYMIVKKAFKPEPLQLRTPTPQLCYDPKLTDCLLTG